MRTDKFTANASHGNAAMTYAQDFNLSVFPLDGKRPLGKLAPHGHKSATVDPDRIREWWSQAPNANIGVACGPSGVLGIDVDPRHGGDDRLHDLERELGPLPETVRSETGGGGAHVIFRLPRGRLKASLGDGIDVKARGGYLVVPSSVHPNGKRYEWEIGPDEAAFAELPDAWLKRLRQERKRDSEADLQGPIPYGQRHSRLLSAAGAMRWHGMSAATIETALLMANRERCRPPLPEDEIRGIARWVAKKPAAPPWKHDAMAWVAGLGIDLTPSDRLVLFALFSRANSDGKVVGGDWVCTHTGLTDRGVYPALGRLAGHGLIAKTGKLGRANVWQICSACRQGGLHTAGTAIRHPSGVNRPQKDQTSRTQEDRGDVGQLAEPAFTADEPGLVTPQGPIDAREQTSRTDEDRDEEETAA